MPYGGKSPGTLGGSRPLAYQTMTLPEIAALPVDTLAADDAVLWLWTTSLYLPKSFAVVEAWGFRYCQTLVWGKNNPLPLGSVAPSAAEFLLVGKRGKPVVDWVFPSSVIVTPRPSDRTHSRKPDCFLDYIEAASPAPRLEMFARKARLSGWDYWGNESFETARLADG